MPAFTALLLRVAAPVAAIVFVIADATSTETVLALGGYEANPIMAPFVDAGLLWPVTFVVVAAIVWFARPLADLRNWFDAPLLLIWLTCAGLALWRFLVVMNNREVANQLALLSAT